MVTVKISGSLSVIDWQRFAAAGVGFHSCNIRKPRRSQLRLVRGAGGAGGLSLRCWNQCAQGGELLWQRRTHTRIDHAPACTVLITQALTGPAENTLTGKTAWTQFAAPWFYPSQPQQAHLIHYNVLFIIVLFQEPEQHTGWDKSGAQSSGKHFTGREQYIHFHIPKPDF